MIITRSNGTLFRRLSKRMHATTDSMSSPLDSLRRLGSEGHRVVASASVLRNKKCVESGGGHLVRDGMYWFFLENCAREVRERKHLCHLNARLVES